ncbi:MAG: helix-turn-helix transcriptional regulator [Bacteroidales bacterium]|nr:helix-turn-helix transcriptional regulator [Bacteroidales bacterium]
MMLSEKLKEQRKQCNLPQRKVAAALDIDTATYCKIENGNYSPKREQVIELASILNTDAKELLTLWLADQIKEITELEKDIAEEAMEIVKMR